MKTCCCQLLLSYLSKVKHINKKQLLDINNAYYSSVLYTFCKSNKNLMGNYDLNWETHVSYIAERLTVV